MMKHEAMPDFKRQFEKETGIKLDYRVMAYLANTEGKYPIYDRATAVEVIEFLEGYLNNYIEANKHQYPDFDGFVFKPRVEMKKLKHGTLKEYIENYITEVFQRKVTAKKHKPVLNRGDAMFPHNIIMADSDAKLATEIGKGNRSKGVRIALRAFSDAE